MAMDEQNLERLEILAGSRRGGRDVLRKAAVRIEDLGELLQLPPALKSGTVSAAPTQDEHNALVADVKALHAALTAVRHMLQKRIVP
jgi:hypothetical protein